MVKYLMISVWLLVDVFSLNARDHSFDTRLKNVEKSMSCELEKQKESTFLVFSELLWWKSTVLGMQYAISHDSAGSVGGFAIDTNHKLYDVIPSWSAGLRVGIEHQFSGDQWNISLVGLNFQQFSKGKPLNKADFNDLHTTWEQTRIIAPDSARADLYNSLRTFDFLFGKSFFWSAQFTSRFAVGLRAAQVKEKELIVYTGIFDNGGGIAGGSLSDIHIKNYFKGMGFVAHFDGHWATSCGIKIYGITEVALLKGGFFLEQKQHTSLYNGTVFDMLNSNRPSSIKSNFFIEGGFDWGFDLSQERGFFGLSMGYSLSYWPANVILWRFIDNGPGAGGGPLYTLRQTSDISFQGFNLKATYMVTF